MRTHYFKTLRHHAISNFETELCSCEVCLGYRFCFWSLMESYANFSFYKVCHGYSNDAGMLEKLDAFLLKFILSLLICMWRGFTSIVPCKALYGRRIGGTVEETGRSLKPVTLFICSLFLLTFLHSVWIPSKSGGL